MRLYTRTGDDGTTGLLGGVRTPKTSLRIAAIGEVDELNAMIGVVRTSAGGNPPDELLARIQVWLFDLGAELASPPDGKFRVEKISERNAQILEASMDEQTQQLPPLKAFILPGGSDLAARLHLARCVCRRAERAVVALHESEPVREALRIFMNRLSDWLFVSARTANASQGVNDIEWRQSNDW